MRRIIAGNWKMNGLADVAGALAEGISASLEANPACDVVVCPPFTVIGEVTKILKGTGVATGGQDCHAEATGAFTGSVSAEMLADLGCRYVIVGHSERRHSLGETDEMVFAKAEAAHRAGLTPIICVGETQAEREAGRALEVVAQQLKGSVPTKAGIVVIAYEPVWAIGTGLVPTMADVEEVHRHIRSDLVAIRDDGGDIPIQYGGSAKPENAAELLAVPEVDGLLIGGASLDAASFCAMVDAAG